VLELRVSDLVVHQLGVFLQEAERAFEGDVIQLRAAMRMGVDDAVRSTIETLRETSDERERLVVFLETPGGSIEVVERLYNVARRHYNLVDFVIPNYAYSAGTILALSGDRIFMDYYSILGPIDPQIESEDGKFVPGMGYLAKFREISETANAMNRAFQQDKGPFPQAEIAYLLKRFDPAKLFHIEQATEHAKSLLRAWLPRHKFKNWNSTAERGVPVTNEMKEKRANDIAEALGDAEKWHSHGRGITKDDLQSDDIKLLVDDFSEDDAMNKVVRPYYELFTDFCNNSGTNEAMHSRLGVRRI